MLIWAEVKGIGKGKDAAQKYLKMDINMASPAPRNN